MTAFTSQWDSVADYMILGFAKITIPNRIATESFLDRMEAHGLSCAGNDDCDIDFDGKASSISFQGDDVNGYFLDEDGMEAASSDIEAFFDGLLLDGEEVVIEGFYHEASGAKIGSRTIFANLDNTVLRKSMRWVTHRDANEKVILEIDEIQDHLIETGSQNGNVVRFARRRAA